MRYGWTIMEDERVCEWCCAMVIANISNIMFIISVENPVA